MKQYIIEAGTAQHIGDRKEQQDRVALLSAPRASGYLLAILADGMGGSKGGAMAAEQIIHTAKLQMNEFSPLTHTVESLLETIVKEAHTVIKLIGMAADNQPHTTVVALMLTPDRKAIWAHAGDSRLYRFSGPNFRERTVDHSHVETLVKKGEITREQAMNHRLANLLVNGLGGKLDPFVSIGNYANLQPGDSFLICSDGLWSYFSEVELAPLIMMNTPRDASEALIKKARERARGNGDNCSFAIIKLISTEKPVVLEKPSRTSRTRSPATRSRSADRNGGMTKRQKQTLK
jgi:serine/threonine protein phosphatase PrpC